MARANQSTNRKQSLLTPPPQSLATHRHLFTSLLHFCPHFNCLCLADHIPATRGLNPTGRVNYKRLLKDSDEEKNTSLSLSPHGSVCPKQYHQRRSISIFTSGLHWLLSLATLRSISFFMQIGGFACKYENTNLPNSSGFFIGII